MATDLCPVYSPFFAAIGCASAIVFTSFGASYGTAKSSVGVMAAGILRPNIQNLTPVVFAGILAIYGLVVSVLISTKISSEKPTSLAAALIQLGAGISVGLSGLAAGFAIGIVGDAGVRATAQQPRLFAQMTLILIFAEVLGLYGMIVALLMLAQVGEGRCG